MWSEGVSIDIPRLADTAAPVRMTRFHVGAAAFAAVVLLASVVTWTWTESNSSRSQNGFARSVAADMSAERGEARRILEASGDNDFFGIPVISGRSTIVVGNRDEMDGYANQVARLAYAATTFASEHNASVNVVEARTWTSNTLDEESDPYYALPVLRIQTATKKVGDSADSNAASLGEALAIAKATTPDRLFVVIAQPLSENDQNELQSMILASDVPVNIIGLGDAASASFASCSPLAAVSGGKFLPVSDAILQRILDRCRIQMPSRAR